MTRNVFLFSHVQTLRDMYQDQVVKGLTDIIIIIIIIIIITSILWGFWVGEQTKSNMSLHVLKLPCIKLYLKDSSVLNMSFFFFKVPLKNVI